MTTNKRKENHMGDLYHELRNLDIDAIDIDREIALSAFGKLLAAEYTSFAAEPPEWLPVRIDQLTSDIRSKRQAIIRKRMRELQNRKLSMLPKEQKLANIDTELAALAKQLEP